MSGGNSTIKELIIDSFGGAGISISGTGGSIVSDNIIHANNRGVYDNAASDQFFRNVIYGNSGVNGEGIYLDSGASGVKIYQNTIHGNSTRGISQAGGSATIRNNLITGSGGVGLYSSGGTLTESYNGITYNASPPGQQQRSEQFGAEQHRPEHQPSLRRRRFGQLHPHRMHEPGHQPGDRLQAPTNPT